MERPQGKYDKQDPFNWDFEKVQVQKKKDHFLPHDFENLRILLVEDNKVNQMLSKKILKNKGFISFNCRQWIGCT